MRHYSTLLVLTFGLAANAQTTHTIQVIDDEFLPPTLNIQLGDAIHLDFVDPQHTFTEVSMATWMANGDTPLPGGFAYGLGTGNPGTDFTFTPTALGITYYICELHVDNGMKGTFTVLGNIGLGEVAIASDLQVGPNPANEQVTVRVGTLTPNYVLFHDLTGKLCKSATVLSGHPITVLDLSSGIYIVEVRDQAMQLLGTRRISVAH